MDTAGGFAPSGAGAGMDPPGKRAAAGVDVVGGGVPGGGAVGDGGVPPPEAGGAGDTGATEESSSGLEDVMRMVAQHPEAQAAIVEIVSQPNLTEAEKVDRVARVLKDFAEASK